MDKTRINITLDVDTYDKLKVYSAKQNISMNAVINIALKCYDDFKQFKELEIKEFNDGRIIK